MSFQQVWDCQDLMGLIYSFDRTYHDIYSSEVLDEFETYCHHIIDDDDFSDFSESDFSGSGFGSIIDLVNFDDDETTDISDDDTFDDDDDESFLTDN